MSRVTNAILYFGCMYGVWESRALSAVNDFFEDDPNNAPGFVSVEDERLPQHWYGGWKSLEVSLAIGAFNYLDIDALVEHLCNLVRENVLEWRATQLIIMEQEAEGFRVIDITAELDRRDNAAAAASGPDGQ